MVLPTTIAAATWQVDRAASRIEFQIQHFGVDTVYGSFGEYEGTVRWDGDPQRFAARASVAVESIDTGINLRDSVLQNEDYFDSARFPMIEYRAESLVREAGDWILRGTLTIRGVAREVELTLGELPTIVRSSPGSEERLRLAGSGTLDRTAFGITPPGLANRAIGRTVTVEIEILAGPVTGS